MGVWDERLSSDYEGRRFVVDGDLIELHAYEYGDCQADVAERFHAEPLEECDEAKLEAENERLRELAADMYEQVTFRGLGLCGSCIEMEGE